MQLVLFHSIPIFLESGFKILFLMLIQVMVSVCHHLLCSFCHYCTTLQNVYASIFPTAFVCCTIVWISNTTGLIRRFQMY